MRIQTLKLGSGVACQVDRSPERFFFQTGSSNRSRLSPANAPGAHLAGFSGGNGRPQSPQYSTEISLHSHKVCDDQLTGEHNSIEGKTWADLKTSLDVVLPVNKKNIFSFLNELCFESTHFHSAN